MRKIIFTKYSNERSDDFKIATSVIQDSSGSKIVEKRALTKQAENHINNIYDFYLKLKDYYKNTNIAPNVCSLKDSKALFEYIEGESLENMLDKHLDKNDFKAVIDEIENYIAVIKNTEIVPFKACDDFKNVFGNVLPIEGCDAFKISNIDIIFSNIIINDKWNVLDYEWTFYFPVPVNYVVYRAVKFYSELFTKRKVLVERDIYSFLGINEKERKIYEHMEECFQAYTLKGHNPSWKLYENLRGNNIDVRKIIDDEINSKNNDEIQVFFDYGDGFFEENSYKILRNFDEDIDIETALKDGINALRIDPGADFCIADIIEAVGFKNEYYDLEIQSNGKKINDNCFVFTTDDPQFYFNKLENNTSIVKIKIKIEKVSRQTALNFSKFVYNTEKEKEENARYINELIESIGRIDSAKLAAEKNVCEKENCIQEKEKYIQELIASIDRVDKAKIAAEKNVQEKEKYIQEKEKYIQELIASIDRVDKAKIAAEENIQEKEKYIQELTASIDRVDKARIIAEENLQEKDSYIAKIKRTMFWKLYTIYLKIRGKYNEF